jgi:hypothetical protein
VSKFEEPLIALGVRRSEEYTDTWEVYVELRGETHYESEEIANEAMADYLASMGPTIMEPARCIVIPRPQRHISTIKIFKNSHMVKFCVPCGVYTTISACPCCGVPTLGSGRLPGVEDAGVRARREQQERDSRAALKPEPGTVSETPDGPVIEVEAHPVENPNDYYVDTNPPPPGPEADAVLADFVDRAAVLRYVGHQDPTHLAPHPGEALNGTWLDPVAHPNDPTNELADPENCRRCTDCVNEPHHWVEEFAEGDEEEEGDPELVWGCKHCDVQFHRQTDLAVVDYALHTQERPEMLLAGIVGQFVGHLAAELVRIQVRMPDRSWHTVDEVKPYAGPSHLIFLWTTGFARRHTAELIEWRPILAHCDCSAPDGPCGGCDDPHGHTCRACDEEWCQACWLLSAHHETCPAESRDERAG